MDEQQAGPEERQVPHEEQALAKSLLEVINNRLDSDEWKAYLKDIETNREYARGCQHSDGDDGLVRTNIIHSVLSSMVPAIYARDPDIAITPRESVTPDRYEAYREFGLTAEQVLRSQFAPQQAALKRKAKSAVRSTMTTGIGWAKCIYQKDFETDPLISDRLKDAQDNLARINAMIDDIENKEQAGDEDLEVKKRKLEEQIKALQEEPEVVRAEGLIIERVLSDNIIWSDEVMDPDNLHQADWITHQLWYSEEKCKTVFGFVPSRATRYESGKKNDSGQPAKSGKDNKTSQLVRVFEMWNGNENRVYTLIDGYHGFARKPYTPKRVGERFYAFFDLVFNPVDGSPFPLADVTLLRELQDEYNTTRTNFAYHRRHSVPHWVGLDGKVTQKDAAKLQNAQAMEIVLIEGDESQPIANYLHYFPNPPIDPSVYDVTPIRVDVEQLMGQGDAARGVVANPKTATEANILQQGLSIRVSERQDVVEEWIRQISQYALEICLQEMTFEQVQRIAGVDAKWPQAQMSKDQIHDLVQLEVKAGTTGKPDKLQEQEQWIKMLPELRETLLQIAQLRAAQQDEQADILYKLTEETLRRFDEKLDLESFFPREEEQEQEEQARRQQAAAEQQREALLMMKERLAEINNKNADTIKKLADAEAAEVGTQMNEYVSQVQALEQLITAALNPQQPPQQLM